MQEWEEALSSSNHVNKMLESHFQPLADTLGIAVDKVGNTLTLTKAIQAYSDVRFDLCLQARYVLLIFVSLPVAVAFRHLLHPSYVSLPVRHTVSIVLGLTWAVICFDW